MKIAHPFIGLIIASTYEHKFLKDKSFYSEKYRFYFWITAIIGAVFPDIDALYMIFVNQLKLHHELLTHSLIPYLIIYSILILIVKFKKISRYVYHLINVFYLGVFSHLFVDSFNFPMHPLSPISDYTLLIKLFPLSTQANHLEYIMSGYFVIELVLILVGLGLLYRKKWDNKKYKRFLLIALSGILIISSLGLIKTYFIYETYFK